MGQQEPEGVRFRFQDNEMKITGASDCGLPQGQRVKGKQVKILYDLVTVIGERKAMCQAQPLTNCWEGCFVRGSISQETCRLLVQELWIPDHELLVVPYWALPLVRNVLVALPFTRLVRGVFSCPAS